MTVVDRVEKAIAKSDAITLVQPGRVSTASPQAEVALSRLDFEPPEWQEATVAIRVDFAQPSPYVALTEAVQLVRRLCHTDDMLVVGETARVGIDESDGWVAVAELTVRGVD